MKESYGEVLARHTGPELYADDGDIVGVATAGVRLGPANELRNMHLLVCRPSLTRGRQYRASRHGKSGTGHNGVYDLEHGRKLQTREPGDPMSLSEEVADSGPKTSRRVQRT